MLLGIGIKHRVGGRDSTWDCRSMGHYVPPDVIAKRISKHNFGDGHLRFIASCLQCKRQVGYHCELGEDKHIYKSEYDLDSPSENRNYFSDVQTGKSTFESVESCFCGHDCVELEKLCDRHLIEFLVRQKFANIRDRKEIIDAMQHDNGSTSNRTQRIVEAVVANIRSINELTEFTLEWFEIVPKLKVVKSAASSKPIA